MAAKWTCPIAPPGKMRWNGLISLALLIRPRVHETVAAHRDKTNVTAEAEGDEERVLMDRAGIGGARGLRH